MYNFTSGLSSIQQVWWWSLMIPINFHIFGGVSRPLNNFLVPWWYEFTKHCKICAVFSCFQITHLHTYTYAHIHPYPYIIYLSIYIYIHVCLLRCFRIIYMYKITSSNIEAVFQCPKRIQLRKGWISGRLMMMEAISKEVVEPEIWSADSSRYFRYSFLLKNKIMEEIIKIWFVAGYSENFYIQNSFKSWNKSWNTYLNKHWDTICVGECLPMTLGNAS